MYQNIFFTECVSRAVISENLMMIFVLIKQNPKMTGKKKANFFMFIYWQPRDVISRIFPISSIAFFLFFKTFTSIYPQTNISFSVLLSLDFWQQFAAKLALLYFSIIMGFLCYQFNIIFSILLWVWDPISSLKYHWLIVPWGSDHWFEIQKWSPSLDQSICQNS